MKPVICWWSGGITSAVACKLAIDWYGQFNCRVIMIDTRNEDKDTYRFKNDCEKWYGVAIETINNFGDKYECIQDVWYKYLSLNVANGAVCSSELKRRTREKWEKENEYSHQVFGFEFTSREFNRALAMKLDHPHTKPIYPLLHLGMDKIACMNYVIEAELSPPRAYTEFKLHNNNCLETLCVQGGIGYFQLAKREHKGKFDEMARVEHELTDLKGQPVTMLKDQSNAAKAKEEIKKFSNLVFLKKHPDYPDNKCIDDMKGREPKPLMDCNGFCGLDELNIKNKTENELNFEGDN